MTVHFIGAGPGDPELITVRGRRLIESCPVCLYAGSLVPEAVVAAAPADARVIDTALLTLDDIIDEIVAAHDKGKRRAPGAEEIEEACHLGRVQHARQGQPGAEQRTDEDDRDISHHGSSPL